MEIERKFLVNYWPAEAGQPWRIVQTYIYDETMYSGLSSAVMRLRELTSALDGDVHYHFTAKVSHGSTVEREEVEFEIDQDMYEFLLASPRAGEPIEKVRFRHYEYDPDLTFDIDWFEGDHFGLWLAEVEFPSLEEAEDFDPGVREWLGDEVTDDPNYLNSNLAHSRRVPSREEKLVIP